MEFRTAAELIVSLTAAGNRDFAANTTQIVDSSGVILQTAALWVDYVKNMRKKVLIKSQC